MGKKRGILSDVINSGNNDETNLVVKMKKLDVDAKVPLLTEGNACFDFYAIEDKDILGNGIKVRTGLSMEIPEGYHMKLFMRSSTGANTTLRLSNCVGIVDSSYRGEVMGLFDNEHRVQTIHKGDRFMQGLIEKNVPIEFEECEDLGDTNRGDGGFGSTGK